MILDVDFVDPTVEDWCGELANDRIEQSINTDGTHAVAVLSVRVLDL